MAIRFCPATNQLFWVHSLSTNVYRFDLDRNLELPPLGGLHNMTCLAVSPDGKWLAMANWDGQIRVLNPATGEPGPVWPAHPGWLLGLAFSPDSLTLASGGNDQLVRLWQAGTWKAKGKLGGNESEVWDIIYSRDGRTLFTAGKDGTARVFPSQPPPPGFFNYEFPDKTHGGCFGWVVSEHGERALVAKRDSSLEIWDGIKGTVVETRAFPLTRAEICSANCAPGIFVYAITNGDILLLDADAKEPIARCPACPGSRGDQYEPGPWNLSLRRVGEGKRISQGDGAVL